MKCLFLFFILFLGLVPAFKFPISSIIRGGNSTVIKSIIDCVYRLL